MCPNAVRSSWLQFVMKNIKLGNSSAKERTAAEQEASLLSKLQHPNIVSYKESFQDSHGILHIVMGYCEGGDLCTRLKAQKGVSLQYALSSLTVTYHFVSTLVQLHSANSSLLKQVTSVSQSPCTHIGAVCTGLNLSSQCLTSPKHTNDVFTVVVDRHTYHFWRQFIKPALMASITTLRTCVHLTLSIYAHMNLHCMWATYMHASPYKDNEPLFYQG